MGWRINWMLVLFAVTCCACDKKPETLVESGYDQAEMDAAIARARKEVDSFIAELSKENGTNFAVKAPISDEGKVEHFWLIDIQYADGKFSGKINNDPGIVKNVKIGQAWTLGKDEISDWMFMRHGKMHGNYTMRPLLKTMPEAEAEKYRGLLAEP
jgi:uncharacterized protein YegJ (DUF2314 family)